MNKLTKTLATAALLALVVSLSACSPKPIDESDHKAQTKACLISPEVVVPGTPDKQLAADLVEAEILYGLAVREVKINQVASSIPNKLLDALQAGCVLMVSSTQDFLLPLADFAKIHPNMMVLFVGSEIDAIIQPANFRWVADDLVSGARLAGYFAASVAVTEDVYLFVQKKYFQAKEIQTAFQSGVRDFEFDSKVKKNVVKIISPDALVSLLGSLDSDGVVTIFAGKSTWMLIEQQESSVPFILGADLQLGETTMLLDARVQSSIERKTSKFVLSAVSDFLDRKFNSEPRYRKPGALKFDSIGLTFREPNSVENLLLEGLTSYRSRLITQNLK